MSVKCGLTAEGQETNSCKECVYDGFEKKEECHDRQMVAIDSLVSKGEEYERNDS